MKNFSLFAQAQKLTKSPKAVELGRISTISRKNFDEGETLSFSCGAPGVEYACLLIENAVLLRTNRTGRIYAGFEKLSHMEPIIERYLRIADVSESVYVFGEPDWKPPRHPNIRIIPLMSDFKLAGEWFLIVDSTTLQVAVVAENQDASENSAPDDRRFNAIKTGNRDGVVRLVTAVEGLIDWTMAA